MSANTVDALLRIHLFTKNSIPSDDCRITSSEGWLKGDTLVRCAGLVTKGTRCVSRIEHESRQGLTVRTREETVRGLGRGKGFIS